MIRFKDFREVIAKTDAISICLTSKNGDIDSTYINIDAVSNKYDFYSVLGFAMQTAISIKDSYGKNINLNGIEFYLDDNFIINERRDENA